MLHIFSQYFLQVFFQFSPTFPNDKTEIFPAPVNKCLQEHCEGQSRFLLEWILAVPKMRDILAARLLRQPILYLLCHCPWNISYMTSRVCVLGRLSQLVPQQQCEWLKTTPRCMYKVVRRPLNILLMAAVNEASHSNWKCEASWWQEAESAKQQVVLQDPASTAENSRSNLTFSGWKVWKVHFKRNLRHLLTWLYIEESTPKHRVPAEPLHPASSNCRPAKRRVLTPPRARKTQYDFGGKFHPDLQRIGNTETEKGLACWR